MLSTADIVGEIGSLREKDARDELPMEMSMVLASGELDLSALEPGVFEAFGYNFGYICEDLELPTIEFDPWFDSAKVVAASCMGGGGDGGHTWESTNILCDSVEQAKTHWSALLNEPDREFMIVVNTVERDPSKPGSGWRWQKWGPYVGTHEVKHEYLNDETGIDKVLVASIIQVKHKEA